MTATTAFTRAHAGRMADAVRSPVRLDPLGPLRRLTKSALEVAGLTCVRTSSLPRGFDVVADLKRLRPAPDVRCVFDVGANVGDVAVRMHDAFPQATVWAFEPVASTHSALRRRVEGKERIKTFQLGLGDKAERRQVVLREQSELNSVVDAVNVGFGDLPSEAVELRTLDEFCDQNDVTGIDLLKTDTEGFDLEVLRGGQRMLGGGHVRFVLTECAFRAEDRRHTNFFTLFELLTSWRLEFFGLYDVHQTDRHLLFCNALFGKSD